MSISVLIYNTHYAPVMQSTIEPSSQHTVSTESYAFQAEINQLMSLIINTFYSNKDIFLRELISNASDASDKARYNALKDAAKHGTRDHEIRISARENILVIEDDGVGMTRQEMLDNLGTIANSGTKNFMSAAAEGADINMIGQFGVGFYSAFLVANTVQVFSRSMNEDVTYVWSSDAGGKFTISELSSEDAGALVQYGTRIELDMKDDCTDYLTESTIRKIVKTHSEYVSYPVKLFTTRSEKVEVPDENEDESPDDSEEGKITEVDEDEAGKTEPEPKYEDRVVEEWVLLNTTQPIWLRKPEEITTEEYDAFYKALSNDWESHLAVKHFVAEGSVEFKSLLYLPKRPPFDMFKSGKKKKNIKLYVKRVFIMDDCEELIPEWLSFVTGVVDSEDLPLNVSREMLQQNNIMTVIRKNIVRKCIEMFQDLADKEDKTDYNKFYENFHQSIKLGIHEDEKNRDKLIKLLRFQTARHDAPRSLSEYVNSAKDDNIYYITGSSRKGVENSPFAKGCVEQGHDVLFMVDSIDEYMVQQIKEFDGKKLVNISKDNSLFQTQNEEIQNGVGKLIKDTLPDDIEKVVVSNRLGSAPCCLVSSEYGWSANMERIVKAQTLSTPSQMMFNNSSKKIMEINPEHPIIRRLQSSVTNTDMSESSRKDVVKLLFDTALLNSGYTQEDTSSFVDRVLKMMMAGMDMETGDSTVSVSDQVDEVIVNTSDDTNMEQVD